MRKIKILVNLIKLELWHFWVNVLGKSHFIPKRVRNLIYKTAGMNIQTLNIRSGCTFFRNNVEIGQGSFMNMGVFINGSNKVKIGNNVSIAFNASIITATHELGPENHRTGKTVSFPVTIEDGVWVGANSTILPGVTIGKGCVIAAGSVVNKDCLPNGMYAGVPAKRVKDLK